MRVYVSSDLVGYSAKKKHKNTPTSVSSHNIHYLTHLFSLKDAEE